MGDRNTTICQCWGGSTHGTDDPNVRRCDLCGGIVPADPATGDYLPRATTPVQSETTDVHPQCAGEGSLEVPPQWTVYAVGQRVGCHLSNYERPGYILGAGRISGSYSVRIVGLGVMDVLPHELRPTSAMTDRERDWIDRVENANADAE